MEAQLQFESIGKNAGELVVRLMQVRERIKALSEKATAANDAVRRAHDEEYKIRNALMDLTNCTIHPR